MDLVTVTDQRARSRGSDRADLAGRRRERGTATNQAAGSDDVSLLPPEMESDGLAHGGRPRRVAVPVTSHDLIVRVPVSPLLRTTVRRITRVP